MTLISFQVVHLSTGDMLREAVRDRTRVGIQAETYMSRGELVPDSIIIQVLLDRIQQSDCKKKGWLIDGFPRTATQAAALKDAGIINFELLKINAIIL